MRKNRKPVITTYARPWLECVFWAINVANGGSMYLRGGIGRDGPLFSRLPGPDAVNPGKVRDAFSGRESRSVRQQDLLQQGSACCGCDDHSPRVDLAAGGHGGCSRFSRARTRKKRDEGCAGRGCRSKRSDDGARSIRAESSCCLAL